MDMLKKVVIILSLLYFNIIPVLRAQDSINRESQLSATDTMFLKLKMKWAIKNFENMAYIRSKELSEDIVESGYTDGRVVRLLAYSSYKISDYQEAESYFKELIKDYDHSPEDVYNYSQVLKYNEKYKEADIWLEKYAGLNVKDTRIVRQFDTESKINALKETERYEIKELGFNSKYSDFGAALYNGKLYFASSREVSNVVGMRYAWNETPFLDVYKINNPDEAGFVSAEALKRPVNSRFHDGPVCINKDGSEMFLTRNGMFYYLPKKGNDGISHLKILSYTKNKRGKWTKPHEMPFNSKEYSTGHPSLSIDGQRLYFSSDMPGGFGGTDIYYVVRNDSGWSAPINMGSDINTEGNEMFPFIHASGFLYFSSDGHLGLGGLDLFVAKQKGESYTVKNMGSPINSEMDDFAILMDETGSNGYFSSNRPGGKGSDDIYKFSVINPVTFDLILKGTVTDKETGDELKDVVVKLESTEDPKLLKTQDQGTFSFDISPDITYLINLEKVGYNTYMAELKPADMKIKNGIIEYPVVLKKELPYGIYGNVFLEKTMEKIPGVKLTIIKTGGEPFDVYSDESGEFRVKLEKATTYELVFEKEGFFTKRVPYSTVDREPGYVNVNEFVNLVLEKIEMNKTIEIPNIYYDVSKWDIRPDAAVELDKVVQFLNDNPKIKIELGSHTDSRGSATSNQSLSQKRAQSAVDYIVNKGIASARISAKGYGESKLKNRCADGIKCSEEEHQENRRTEIRIVGY